MKLHKVHKLTPLAQTTVLACLNSWSAELPDCPETWALRKSMFKKFIPPDGGIPKVRRKKALTKFLETETKCGLTNRRIRGCIGKTDYARTDIMYVAKRKIASILGKFDINRMLALGRFGPGSTFDCRGVDVSRAKKFSLTDVTPEFNKIASNLLVEYPLWTTALTDADLPVCPLLTVVPGGRYSTAPKDATIDRSIIVEPTINSWFQQGIGRMIREKFKRKTGCDLDDQTINQALARLGSISDDLATVDLRNASDLICTLLVQDLLDEEWFFWLNVTRSHRVLIDGKWVELEKFSSMGNGFTFDLQSVIFYALSYAVTVLEGFNPFWVNTFGDDIVVPSGVKVPFLKLFEDVGFEVNTDKSFFEGPFRESCGHDYWLGRNIRGPYLRALNNDLDVMKFHNRLYEWSTVTGLDSKGPRSLLRKTASFFVGVPPCLGDMGFHASFDEVCPPVARGCWEGFRVKALVPVLEKTERADRFLLLDRLQGSESDGNLVALRRDPIGYRVREITTRW